ncbi:MAG: class I SAM-dependent methyltransferase [Crocinitomicaceae bacterium]
MNTLSNCPICNKTKFDKVLSGKDYTVSKDTFTIVSCLSCGFQFTNPIPTIDKIGDYYKAESYISHTSSKKGLINRIYHFVRNYTLKQKVRLVHRLAKGNNVLDIGAGTGHFANALKEAGLNSIGLEPDVDARALAKSSHAIELLPIEELYNLADNSQDVVTMWHVLEHVYNLGDDVKQIGKVLKENGTLIVAVPNRLSYDAKKYGEFWAAYDLPIHLYHFTPADIAKLFEREGMMVKQILPMRFDAYYVSMLSEKYKGGSMIRAVWTGFLSNFKAKKGSYSSQIYILQKKS